MSKEFKCPSNYIFDKPFWERGEIIETTPEGIEIRLRDEDKSIAFTLTKRILPGISEKDRDKLKEKCHELGIAKIDEFFGKQKIYGIADLSSPQAIIYEFYAFPKEKMWALLERRLRKEYPKELRLLKRIMAWDERGFSLLMKHAGVDPEESKKEKSPTIYEKQDAFHDVLITVLLNEERHPVEDVVKDLYYLPRKVKLRRIDAYRKYRKEEPKTLELLLDVLKLQEVERASDLTKWIESIKDPKDREIARLRFINKLTVRGIAKGLSLSKSDVDRRIKKLKPPL